MVISVHKLHKYNQCNIKTVLTTAHGKRSGFIDLFILSITHKIRNFSCCLIPYSVILMCVLLVFGKKDKLPEIIINGNKIFFTWYE